MECCTTRKRCFPTWYGSAIYLFVIIVKTYYSIECAILLLLYRHHQKPNKINSFKRVAVSTRCYIRNISADVTAYAVLVISYRQQGHYTRTNNLAKRKL